VKLPRWLEVEIVSSGGTGTYDLTSARARVTEIQAGSYAFMDTAHAAVVSQFEFALTVLAMVISRHGNTLVLDAGKKTLGLDTPPPILLGHAGSLQYVAEEHTVFHVDADAELDTGSVVELVPSYCPVTVNLHDVYHVVEDGTVTEIWPIVALGPGWNSI
jgi:3-hydroxy-D-aspartate aldolase